MAASGFTPISLYYSTTASAVPTSGNLANGELGLNIADMKLYAKNSAGTVTLLASSGGASGTVSSVAVSGGTTGLTTSGGPITTSGTITLAGTLGTANGGTGLTSFTSGGVVYASSTSALATGSALTFSGSVLGVTGAITTTDNITITKPTGVPRIQIVATTGTNEAYLQATNTGGSYYVGAENSAGSWFGATAYALAISAPAGRVVDTLIAGSKKTTVSASGLAITGTLSVSGVSTFSAGTAAIPAINTTGDTNTGIFFPAADTVATSVGGSEGMRLTSTGLGIGTSSPAYKLHAVKTGGGIVGRFDNADGVADIYGYGLEVTRSIAYIKGSGALHLGSAAGYSAVVLDSAGNLGLGVTPSAWDTALGSRAIQFTGGSVFNYRDTNLILTQNAYFDGAFKYYASSIAAGYYDIGSGTHKWFTAPSGTAGNTISFTQAMTLDASSNLQLGTTLQKGSRLNVMGGNNVPATSGSTQNGGLRVSSLTTGSGGYVLDMGVSDTNGYAWMQVSNSANLASGFAKDLVIQPVGGNLLVGGTAARGTTVGSAHLDLFNGTAPAGTLTNGVSLYSSSGDLKFMNAAGDAFDVGYRNIPQNAQTGNYTLTLADSGDHIYHAVGAGAATYTIPANSSVAYPIGTAITFINMAVANVTIAITTDTMYLSSAGTTGSRTLAQYGSATAIKITSTNWLISGSGLT